MRQRGLSLSDIADVVGTSRSTVRRAVERSQNHGTPVYRKNRQCGRKRCTTRREDRLINLSVRRRRTVNATQVKARLQATTGTIVSTGTIRNRLHERGLNARRRAACPSLLPVHRVSRRIWAETHLNWGIAEWGCCMFSDECRFTLYESDGRILVWRERNERYIEENMEARVAFGGGSVSVWGGVIRNGKTELLILIGQTMNAVRYRDLCLNEIVLPFAQNFGDGFILVDDNARPHRAQIVQEFLRENGIERMNWPARSPDMNVIEHVWSRMKLKLNQREQEFQNLEELAIAVRDEWEAVPQEFIRNLVDSMPRRIAEVLRVRGGPTRY